MKSPREGLDGTDMRLLHWPLGPLPSLSSSAHGPAEVQG